jgi:hypothetical protein
MLESKLVQWLGYGVAIYGIVVRFPVGARDFSLLRSLQTGFGAHPTSFFSGTGGQFPEI